MFSGVKKRTVIWNGLNKASRVFVGQSFHKKNSSPSSTEEEFAKLIIQKYTEIIRRNTAIVLTLF